MQVIVSVLFGVLSTVIAGKCGAAQTTELIEAQEGDKVTLECCTDPPTDLKNYTLTCTRTDGNFSGSNQYVYSRRHGVENPQPQMEQYKNRTHLVLENLREGVLSLEISPVQTSDGGQYKCFIVTLKIPCHYTVTVNGKRNWTEVLVMTTASVEVTTNPDEGPKKPPGWIIAIVIAAAAVLVVVAIRVLWKLKNMRLCEKLRGRRDEEVPWEMENLRTKAAESDENVTGAANGQRNLQQ
ncbi:myelin-oligodendrocyte glycoprotein-like [Amphiprion ocellaris]|uniref:myelin-oligodendrocyte glycoprotein-like n=1 Tax=Amphiprion ocellaris TaxID=80972 RepID=UPI0024112099|nr:myelin-oligodendrocyte glycoprotein-like [Amphiprion ocellaris]